MKDFLLCVTFLASLSQLASAKSIIGFGAPGIVSHQAALAQIGLELVKRGHTFKLLLSTEDTLMSSRLAKDPFQSVQTVNFSGPANVGTDAWLDSLVRDPPESFVWLRNNGLRVARSLMEDQATVDDLRAQKFDLVLRDIISWPTMLLAQALDLPEVDVFSAGALHPCFAPRWSVPNPIAYVPALTSGRLPNQGFLGRLANFLETTFLQIVVLSDKSTEEAELAKSFGYQADGRLDRLSTAAAVIVGSDWGIEYPHPVPPTIHFVGPIMAQPAKPLEGELKAFLDQPVKDGKPGGVFVSMGTAVRLTEPELRGMAASLAALNRPVLWKISNAEVPGNLTVEDLQLAKLVRPTPWAPQNDVLAHPGTAVFVTHGGANSIYEAGYQGTPIVSIPFFADQHFNSAKGVHHGFGVRLTNKQLGVDKQQLLTDAINKVIGDDSYRTNAQKVMKRLRKPRTPAEQAADVVEHVLNTEADPYLQTAEHLYSWWQLALLDVYLFLFAVVSAVVSILGLAIYMLAKIARASMSRQCKQKAA